MTRDDALLELAEIQHGLAAWRQIHRLGFDDREVDRRIARGDWKLETCRVLRRVGAPRTRDQQLMVAVLDGPPGSMLSKRSAAEVWGVPSFAEAPLEITHLRHGSLHPRPIATVHRPTLLLPHHVTEVRGIRTTTLPRTLFDIAPLVHPDRLDVIIDRVLAKIPGVLRGLHALMPELAARGRPGIAVMREQLSRRPPDYVPVASGLERRFERILESAGERSLRRQVDLGGHEWLGRVDFLDDDLLLVVEVDSILHHTTPGDRARDAARDRALLAAGFAKVVRVPEEHIWYEPARAVAAVRQARAELRGAVPSTNPAANRAQFRPDSRPGSEGGGIS
jgi:very-short-patch-repair endonuclease